MTLCRSSRDPNYLLLMKSKLIIPPPGSDLYCRKRWRWIQYLANEFWSRWRREYFQNLQVRNKWHGENEMHIKKTFSSVMKIFLEVNCGKAKLLRQFQLKMVWFVRTKISVGTSSLDGKGKRTESKVYLDRSIHKLVLIYESDLVPVPGFPDK